MVGLGGPQRERGVYNVTQRVCGLLRLPDPDTPATTFTYDHSALWAALTADPGHGLWQSPREKPGTAETAAPPSSPNPSRGDGVFLTCPMVPHTPESKVQA